MKKWVIVLIIFLISIPLVFAEPPKISLIVKPTEGDAPLSVLASEQSGDATILSWLYDFGNGDKPFTEKEAAYTYDKPGEYVVSLEVQNEKGETAKDSVTVIVKEPATPIPTPTPEPKPDENTTTKIVWQGTTPIAAAFTAKASEKGSTELDAYEKSVVLSTVTDTVLKVEKYPLDISPVTDTKTVIIIEKFRCTVDICGYWITATRDGQEVATNSPIWISPPPYEVLVSESFDSAKNEQTVTLKEDPKLAVAQVLQSYCDRQPLGMPVVGTKE